MEWLDVSEKIFGLIWTERRMPTAYSPEMFAPPYSDAIRVLQKKGACKEDVLKKINDRFIQNAIHSVQHLNGLGDEKVWDDALSEAADNYELSKTLRKAANALEKNEEIDLLPIYGKLTSRVANESTGLTKADQVDYKNYKPFMKCGYGPIDDIIGGIPSDGPILAYGLTGVGKSFWLANLVTCWLRTHKKKTAAIYTLEMSAEHWLARTLSMYPDMKDVLDRLYVSGAVRNIDELVAEITSKNVDLVGLDDMDGIVQDEAPSEYQKVYKRIREICRFLKIPVAVLAQPSRATKQAIEDGQRFLSPYDIAWSGAGENAAALQVALQRTNSLDMQAETFPMEDEDREYMIFWKSRDGWPKQVGPGAIRLEKHKQLWRGEPYQNKLWRPNSSKSVIGKSNGNNKARR